MIAKVIVDVESKQVNRPFDYIIPKHLEGIVDVGYRVIVPFGKLKRSGFIVAIDDKTDSLISLKEIIDVVDVFQILSSELIDVAKYIHEYYFSFYITALKAMVPAALKVKYKKVAIKLNEVSVEAKDIFKRKEISLDSLSDDKLKIIYEEAKLGNVKIDTVLKQKKNTNLVKYVKLNDFDNVSLSKRGKELVEYLEEINSDIELDIIKSDLGYSSSVIETLKNNKVITIYEKEIFKEEEKEVEYKKIDLNDYQKKAIEKINLNNYSTNLIHGVTGSGKTLIYMELIEKVINRDKQAIMLVPEISLTPQITALFKARFKSNIAIIHSRLSTNEKYQEWKKIYSCSVKIVVGARSAIFAPFKNLGIIIIDEEHDSSYIQTNNPKYNTIDIAKKRAIINNCPLILGSATPKINDYFMALNGDYNLITLPTRANKLPLPKIRVADMREELKKGNRSVLSEDLKESIKKCYKAGEQSILFINRRGYSSFVMCRSCGEPVKCPHCDISLTYHYKTNNLKCHICGYQRPNVSKCDSCGSDKIRYVGSGTEKIVDEVEKLLPEANVLRADLDTASNFLDYENIYNQFKNKEAHVLVGTQMITKGLDFENVTLVGIVNADLALNYPTFDATEVAFDLICQTSCRSGRSKKEGNVIIQTYNPNHYVIKCSLNHDYDMFYNMEIRNRRIMNLPPFSSLIEIKVISKNAEMAYNEANLIVNNLKKVTNISTILGPAEDYVFKKNDNFTFLIQIKALDDEVINKIEEIYPLYQSNKDVNIAIERK